MFKEIDILPEGFKHVFGISSTMVNSESKELEFTCLPGRREEKIEGIKAVLKGTQYEDYTILIEGF